MLRRGLGKSLGILVLSCMAIGMAAMIPDAIRYARIKRM
jgi:hypothetical protein